jgi:hypothetical protein
MEVKGVHLVYSLAGLEILQRKSSTDGSEGKPFWYIILLHKFVIENVLICG